VNVLYFADTRFPIERANGLQSMATCQALAALGHDVTLVTRPDSAPTARDPYEFYGLPPAEGLKFQTIPTSRHPRLRRLRFLLGALRMVLGSRRRVVLTRDLGLASVLLSLPAWRRPRVVFESHGVSAVVSAEMAALLGKPELMPPQSKLARLDRQDRRVWQRAAAYVTITSALADDLAGRFGPREEVFVVPDGAVMPDRFDRESSAGGPAARGSVRTSELPPVAAYAGHL
jgi:hypothetical protein